MRSPVSLSGKARFSTVFTDGRRARSDGITVWILPRAKGYPTHLGLAVSARAGGAVGRNRLRRRLRALVREASIPADVVISAGREAMELSFQELGSRLNRALATAGVSR
jgi:ribonuclease P protein component